MFPIYPNSGFTYDKLSQISPRRIRVGPAPLAIVAGPGLVVLAALAEPAHVDSSEVPIHVAIDDGRGADDAAVAAR